MYHTPYPLEIDALPFPAGFKRLEFQKFDGTQSPREHLMHFIATMGNLARVPDYCLRLFGSSLTGEAFKWYTGLAPNSIPTWERMQEVFLSNFFTAALSSVVGGARLL